MNRTALISRHLGTRLISHSSTVKSTSVVTNEQKEIYYKHLDDKFNAGEDVKPAGWDEALPYKSIPGPKPLPIVGNIWRFLPYVGELYNMDVLNMHEKFHKEFGKIMLLKGIPTVPDTIFLFSPEEFEMVHRNEGVFPIRDALKAFAYYRTVVRKDIFQGIGGLTTVHGKEWYNVRSKVNPILMNPQTALQYVENMDNIATDLVGTIKRLVSASPDGELPADFMNYIYRWTLESVGFIVLDRRLGCLEPDVQNDSEPQLIVNSALEMFRLYYKIEVQPSMWKVFTSKNWNRFIEVLDTMTYTFLKYINESIEKNSEGNAQKEEHKLSVFQRLLRMDRRIAMTMAMDMLTAGVDTTGKSTGAALYYLAKNRDVQDKLRKEIFDLLPNKDSPVTKDVLSNAHYLKAVIKETTRIAPISVGNFRTSARDMVLCGYQIPKGTNILTTNLLLCQSEEHFPKAKEFIPERWLRTTEGELSHKNVHPFIYLPFGFGPRSCIGKRLANLELEVGLAKIIRNFSLEWRHEDMTFQSLPLYGIAKPLRLHVKELEK